MQELKIIELTADSLMNKLFCTFSSKDGLDDTLREINREYTILYKKIFVLASPESEEYMCTYNIELQGGQTKILPNTTYLIIQTVAPYRAYFIEADKDYHLYGQKLLDRVISTFNYTNKESLWDNGWDIQSIGLPPWALKQIEEN